MQQPLYDVFVSHARDDEQRPRLLAEHLRSFGARVFLDLDSLGSGSAWRERIHDALAQSRAVAVLSSSGQAPFGGISEEIRMAIERARGGEQLLIPIFLDEPSPVPSKELRKFRGIYVRDDEGLRAAAEEMAEALHLSPRPAARVFPVISPVLPRRPTRYVDTGFTELLLSAVRLSRQQSPGPLHVTGMAGVGKTTLVSEVCRRLAPDLQILWWVRADNPLTTVADLAALGAALQTGDDGTTEEQARAALSYLQQSENERWLLVFDDIWSGAEVDRWVPAPSAVGTTVLVSRERRLSQYDRGFVLEPLDERESVRFLHRLLGHRLDSDRDIDDELLGLARQCGGSPLALSLVAGLIGESDEPFTRVLEALAKSDVYQPDVSVPDLITTSVLRAVRSSREQAVLLSAIAWAADAALPTRLLLQGAQDALGAETAPEVLLSALEALEARGLVEVSAATVKAHPRVKSVARQGDDVHGIDALVGALAAGLTESSPKQTDSSAGALYPHFLRLVGLLAELPHAPQAGRAVSLLVRAAWSLQGLGRHSEAVELLQRTLLDSERVLGPEHPSTLTVRANLAGVYQGLGRHGEAVELLQRTLLDSERVLGPEHPSTLTVRANLAGVYQGLGRHGEAVELLQRTLLDSERVLGPEHPSTLTVRANLAGVYQGLGRHGEAVELLQRTLLDSERVLGPEHPSTLTVRANLAGVYQGLGRHGEAVELLQRTLLDSERVLGPEHPSTLTVRANLAYILDEGTHGASV